MGITALCDEDVGDVGEDECEVLSIDLGQRSKRNSPYCILFVLPSLMSCGF